LRLTPSGGPASLCRAGDSFASVPPELEEKSPSADLIILNSASQTFVNFAAILLMLRRLSKTFFTFFTFFAGVAYSQLPSI